MKLTATVASELLKNLSALHLSCSLLTLGLLSYIMDQSNLCIIQSNKNGKRSNDGIIFLRFLSFFNCRVPYFGYLAKIIIGLYSDTKRLLLMLSLMIILRIGYPYRIFIMMDLRSTKQKKFCTTVVGYVTRCQHSEGNFQRVIRNCSRQ